MHLPRPHLALTLLLPLAATITACAPGKLCIGDCAAGESGSSTEIDVTATSGAGQSETGIDAPTTMWETPGIGSTSGPDDSTEPAPETEGPPASCDVPDTLPPPQGCDDGVPAPGEFCASEGGGGGSPIPIVSSVVGQFDPGGQDVLVAHPDGTLTIFLDGPEPFLDLGTKTWDDLLPSTGALHLTGVGDFDEDGNLDAVGRAVGDTTDEIVLLRTDGTGGILGAAQVGDQGKLLFGPAAVDWNQDGNLDLLVINSVPGTEDVTILQGDGAGQFTPSIDFGIALDGQLVALGALGPTPAADDFVFIEPDGGLHILINDPGSHSLLSDIGPDLLVRDVAIAELDGNSRGDIIVLADDTATATTVVITLLHEGDDENPVFVETRYQVECGATALALGRLDGDDALDLAVVAGSRTTVRINDGQGGFASAKQHNLEPAVDDLHIFDFTGDGFDDIVGTSSTLGVLAFALNTP